MTSSRFVCPGDQRKRALVYTGRIDHVSSCASWRRVTSPRREIRRLPFDLDDDVAEAGGADVPQTVNAPERFDQDVGFRFLRVELAAPAGDLHEDATAGRGTGRRTLDELRPKPLPVISSARGRSRLARAIA